MPNEPRSTLYKGYILHNDHSFLSHKCFPCKYVYTVYSQYTLNILTCRCLAFIDRYFSPHIFQSFILPLTAGVQNAEYTVYTPAERRRKIATAGSPQGNSIILFSCHVMMTYYKLVFFKFSTHILITPI